MLVVLYQLQQTNAFYIIWCNYLVAYNLLVKLLPNTLS